MKTILKLCLYFVIGFSCFSQNVILIATEEFPPHTSEHMEGFGLECTIVSEAFELEEIKVEYEFYPGARSYHMALNGAVDGALPWVWREEREKDFYFPEPVLTAGIDSFYHLKGYNPQWNPETPDYNKLKDITFGAIIGYNYGEAFQNAEESGLINVERVRTITQNFQKLLDNRIDIFISGDIVAHYNLDKNFSPEEKDKITHIFENNLPTEKFYLILSKKGNNGLFFRNAFNRGLEKLKKSGRYNEILGK